MSNKEVNTHKLTFIKQVPPTDTIGMNKFKKF